MDVKVNAVVLKVVDYKENDKLLTLLSVEEGKIRAVIRGIKKPTAKLRFAGQPFCFSEYVLKKRGDYYSVINANCIEMFYELWQDVEKYYCASIIAEFVDEISLDSAQSDDLALLVVNSYKELLCGENSPKFILCKFFIEGLDYAGYKMQNGVCVKCGEVIEGKAFYSFDSGGGVCESCKENEREIRLTTLKALEKIENGIEEDLDDYYLHVLRLMARYIEYKTGIVLSSLTQFIVSLK